MLSSPLHRYRSFGLCLLAVTIGLPLSGAQVNPAAADPPSCFDTASDFGNLTTFDSLRAGRAML